MSPFSTETFDQYSYMSDGEADYRCEVLYCEILTYNVFNPLINEQACLHRVHVLWNWSVAQSVEHHACNSDVSGSYPLQHYAGPHYFPNCLPVKIDYIQISSCTRD